MASSIPASVPAEAGARIAPGALPTGRKRPWLAWAAIAFIASLIVVAAAAPLLSPYDPVRQSLRLRLGSPTLEASDGRAHLFGTDHLGRDVLSRVIWGARVSLVIGFAAVAVGGIVGASFGILAGYTGGWADSDNMRVADGHLACQCVLIVIAT